MEVPVVVALSNSPTAPAGALLPLVTPLIVGVLIVGDDDTNAVVAICVVLVPTAAVGAVGVPVSDGDARSAYEAAATPPSVVALTAVLQPNPDPLVQFNALDVVLQLGIANAVGLALEPVAFAMTVLAAIAAMPLTPMLPHTGVADEPAETIVCPDTEPAGFNV